MKTNFVVGALGVLIAACAKTPAAPPPATASVAQGGAPGARTAAPAALDGAGNASGPRTIRGELVDLACYLDHGAKGDGHKACATSCALKGMPIGILDKDNKITLVIGEHDRSLNAELAPKMGTTVALTGKVVSRDGVQMIEVSGSE